MTKRKILNRIIQGTLIHADETRANIKGHLAYVWVLTNLREVVYILAESREGEIVQELLKGFQWRPRVGLLCGLRRYRLSPTKMSDSPHARSER